MDNQYRNVLNNPVFDRTKGSNYVSYVLTFFLIVFFIVIVILLFTNASTKSNYIQANTCPGIKSMYASIPNVAQLGLQINNQCGPQPDGTTGNSACSFSGIASLFDAQNICNKYPSVVCGSFSYNPSLKTMNFVNSAYAINGQTTYNANNVDVYIKQI
jgi:hypothetical protein